MKSDLKDLAINLYEVGAVKFGNFVSKAGLKTPVYIDFRLIVSYPDLLIRISKMLWSLVDRPEDYTHVCGVPYTALPMATVVSTEFKVPMLIRRKEAKSYGTKNIIEGAYKPSDRPLIIEDIILSGMSIIDTARDLKKHGLDVRSAVAIVDREQGAYEVLKANGIETRCIMTITELMGFLLEEGKLDGGKVQMTLDYIRTTPALLKDDHRLYQDFASRARVSKNPLGSRLLNLMARKQTTLCLAADSNRAEEILGLADLAGPHIAVLKIHADTVEDFDMSFIGKLKILASQHRFFIMEDRKFADIGQTVWNQYTKGIHRISEWADFVTVHLIPGKGAIRGLERGFDGLPDNRGIFVVAEMSSEGNLTSENYIRNTVAMVEDTDLVVGFVCQKNIFSDPGQIQMTPGVKLEKSADDLGQKYNTPELVVESGADLVVVGRGITKSANPSSAILDYKNALWRAYEKRITEFTLIE